MKYIGLYNNHKKLAKRTAKFFRSDKPKTISAYKLAVGMTSVDMAKQAMVNDRFAAIINLAEIECENWLVNDGLLNDKTFARFYLKEYCITPRDRLMTHEVGAEEQNTGSGMVTVNIVRDDTPSPHNK